MLMTKGLLDSGKTLLEVGALEGAQENAAEIADRIGNLRVESAGPDLVNRLAEQLHHGGHAVQ
jgi:hypothetical protein